MCEAPRGLGMAERMSLSIMFSAWFRNGFTTCIHESRLLKSWPDLATWFFLPRTRAHQLFCEHHKPSRSKGTERDEHWLLRPIAHGYLLDSTFHSTTPIPLPYTPHQLPQIPSLNPLLLATSSDAQPATTASTNAPSLTDIAHYSRRSTSNNGSRRNDHVCRYNGMRQDLDILLDDSKGANRAILAHMHVRRDGYSLDR